MGSLTDELHGAGTEPPKGLQKVLYVDSMIDDSSIRI
jgi:hypothetical protein